VLLSRACNPWFWPTLLIRQPVCASFTCMQSSDTRRACCQSDCAACLLWFWMFLLLQAELLSSVFPLALNALLLSFLGLTRTVYIFTVYDRIFGDFSAKITVHASYIYGSGQPYAFSIIVREIPQSDVGLHPTLILSTSFYVYPHIHTHTHTHTHTHIHTHCLLFSAVLLTTCSTLSCPSHCLCAEATCDPT
jgi:hypothetical protein